MAKAKTSFLLTDTGQAILLDLSIRDGISRGDVLEQLIRRAGEERSVDVSVALKNFAKAKRTRRKAQAK